MMKKLFVLMLFLITTNVWAQSSGFNYKALIANNGIALATQTVDVKFSLLDNTSTAVYEETHTTTTDANGIVSVLLGEGTANLGDFSTINWTNSYSLKVEIDTQDGNGYQDFGTNPFKYVPYAKYAEKAGNVFSGDYADLQGAPDTTNWDTDATDDVTRINDLEDAKAGLGSLYIGFESGDADDGNSNMNTSIGYMALDSIVSGKRNVAIGFEANRANKTGSNNVAVGFQALKKNIYSENTAVGIGALAENRTGWHNVALGASAGRNNNGEGNVFIGGFAGFNATGSNQLYIDNSTTLSPLIYGDFDENFIQINGELRGKDSGDADMKAYIYGSVDSTGNKIDSSSSSGFTVERIYSGKYKITFTHAPIGLHDYIVMATAESSRMNVAATKNNNYFEVYTRDVDSNNYDDINFDFVVYKK